MLYRKFARRIEEFLLNEPRKILLVNGARQIGKSYIIRNVSQKLFKNYVEIDLRADKEGTQIFETVRSTNDFYLQLGAIAGSRLGSKTDTLVFLNESLHNYILQLFKQYLLVGGLPEAVSKFIESRNIARYHISPHIRYHVLGIRPDRRK